MSKILGFLLGKMSADELVAKAKSIEGEDTSEKERLCEAYYYIASEQLFSGKKKAAHESFEKCIATDVTDYTEYTSSKAELARMDSK